MKTPPQIIDTHCHLDIAVFSDHLQKIIDNSRSLGVSDFVLPGYIASGWNNLLKLCSEYHFLHAAPGLHPIYLHHHHKDDLERLEAICHEKKVVAIGEIGLDLLRDKNNEPEQRKLFEAQICLAKKFSLPILIHVRKAHDQVASIIRKKKFEGGGIIHAFNGSKQQAENYIKLGFKLGYGGTLTYSRANRIRSLATSLPLSSIVLETDAPDIPLATRQDSINSPEYLPEVLTALAGLRSETVEEIAAQTTMNAQSVLSLQ